MNELPRNAFNRAVRLAGLPFGVAGRATANLGKRLGGSPAEVVTADFQRRTADQLFRVLGELKGGALKFGQSLSVIEAALPTELAEPYRATLTKLQDSAPALPASTVHEVLAAELGERWRSMFEHFDDVPAAAASIGQVHRATWCDGREVAVKVQYPGAGDALRSDIGQLRRLARLLASLVPGLEVKPLLAEMAERLDEELDYTLEAHAQQAFAEAFAGDPDIAIPSVVHRTSTVLVTEWLPGTPLSQIIASGSQSDRDHAGLLYARFMFSGPARVGMLHADPHPGNYRITADGRLGVLDFGLVNRLPDGLPRPIGQLLRIALDGDYDTVLDGLRAEGFVKPTSTIDSAELLDYLNPLIEPARVETFTFTREWMRAQFQRIGDPRHPNTMLATKLNLPPSYLLINRVWVGGVGVLCQLGAEAPFRSELERWLPGFAPREELDEAVDEPSAE